MPFIREDERATLLYRRREEWTRTGKVGCIGSYITGQHQAVRRTDLSRVQVACLHLQSLEQTNKPLSVVISCLRRGPNCRKSRAMPTSASRALKNLSMSKMGVAHMGHENLQREREIQRQRRYPSEYPRQDEGHTKRRRQKKEHAWALTCRASTSRGSTAGAWCGRSGAPTSPSANRTGTALHQQQQQRSPTVSCGGRAQGADSMRPHLVADGAVVLHRVLDAAVPVAKGRRVAGSCVYIWLVM